MKNKVIALLKSGARKEELYNNLLQNISVKLNIFQLRSFQTGFSESKLEKLIYEVKKTFGISDLDIHNFKDEEIDQKQELAAAGSGEGSADGLSPEVQEQKRKFIQELEADEEVKEGFKIRDEYPFLKDPDCPAELLAIVGKKITAWEQWAEKHNGLSVVLENPEKSFESEEEKNAAVYALAKSAVENFQLNADIKAELDFYKETGKVLGKLPELSNLAIQQEIAELDEAGLVEMKIKSQKNKSKAEKEIEKSGTNEAREKRVKDWGFRLELTLKRLNSEFKKAE